MYTPPPNLLLRSPGLVLSLPPGLLHPLNGLQFSHQLKGGKGSMIPSPSLLASEAPVMQSHR